MQSVLARMKSVYMGFIINVKDNDMDIYSSDCEHMMAIRDGVDQSEALGCVDRFSLEPIPKSCRLYKEVGGKIVKDELFEQRLQERKEFLDKRGVVRSIVDLKASGFDFDKDGVCIKRPVA